MPPPKKGTKKRLGTKSSSKSSANLEDPSKATSNASFCSHHFKFDIDSIENVILSNYPMNIVIKLIFKGEVINSIITRVVDLKANPINKTIIFKIPGNALEDVDELLRFPFVFSVSALKIQHRMSEARLSRIIGQDEIKKNQSKRRKSKQQIKTTQPVLSNTSSRKSLLPGEEIPIGTGNLDILPLLMGEKYLEEVILLEPSKKPYIPKTFGSRISRSSVRAVSAKSQSISKEEELPKFMTVPHIKIKAINLDDFQEDIPTLSNILTFTIESLQNCQFFEDIADSRTFTAAFPFLYPNQNEGENEPQCLLKKHYFTSKTGLEAEPSLGKRKKWYSLGPPLFGDATLSKYRYRCWPLEIFILPYGRILGDETSAFELKSVSVSSSISRKTSKRLSSSLSKKTSKRSEWTSKNRESPPKRMASTSKRRKSSKKNKPRKTIAKQGSQTFDLTKNNKKFIPRKSMKPLGSYVAFLELTDLLYPGEMSTRVASQLFVNRPEEVIEKWGPKKFDEKPLTSSSKTRQQSQKSLRQSLKGEKQPGLSEFEEFVPLVASNGEPVFVVVEVELLRPLKPKPKIEELMTEIENIIPTTVKEEKAQVKNAFEEMIVGLTEIINKEYQAFYEKTRLLSRARPTYIEEQFFNHLHKTGAMVDIHAHIGDVVVEFATSKVGTVEKIKEKQLQEYAMIVYEKLVEKTNEVIHKMDMNKLKAKNRRKYPTIDEFKWYIAEAIENEDQDRALKLLEMLGNIQGKKCCKWWLEYTKIKLHFLKFQEALKSADEALKINKTSNEGLLLYGAICAIMGDGYKAILFLTALTELYPRFYEGWMALHVVHLLFENSDGAYVTFRKGYNAMLDSKRFTKINPHLAWIPDLYNKRDIYSSAASYFLLLNLYQFAAICLHAKEETNIGESLLSSKYYLAVYYYYEHRYKKSIHQLKKALEDLWNDEIIWSLLGHNYFRLGDKIKAREAYKFAKNIARNHDKLGFTYYRLGLDFMDQRQFEDAKGMMQNAVMLLNTPLSWFYYGLTCYNLGETQNAVLGLAQANYLDPTNPDVWAYLALINLEKLDYDKFLQCVQSAKHNNLEAADLINHLEHLKHTSICFSDGTRASDVNKFDQFYKLKADLESTPRLLSLSMWSDGKTVENYVNGEEK